MRSIRSWRLDELGHRKPAVRPACNKLFASSMLARDAQADLSPETDKWLRWLGNASTHHEWLQKDCFEIETEVVWHWLVAHGNTHPHTDQPQSDPPSLLEYLELL